MISQKEIDSVLCRSNEVQFQYLIKRIADYEELWVIEDESGLVLLEADEGEFVLPVWPFKEFAMLYCNNNNDKEYNTPAISIYEFLEDILPDMTDKKYKIAVMPVQNMVSIVVGTDAFAGALIEEIQKYE